MADIDDLFTDPNAGAYETEETRVGPPLTYVGEKLRYVKGPFTADGRGGFA